MKTILSVLLVFSFAMSSARSASLTAEELAAHRQAILLECKAHGEFLKAQLEAAAVANLSAFEFDENQWLGSRRYLPLQATNLQMVAGWSSNAVLLDSSAPAILRYREIEVDGHTNFVCHRGSLRLSFKPTWSSTSLGGTGPGDFAVLFSSGSLDQTASWWGLSLDATGNRLSFAGQRITTNLQPQHR